MSDVKLTLNIRTPPASNGEALTKAAAKKAGAIETMDEAWVRILAMKNSDGDNAKLTAVKRAMADGKVGRDSPNAKFSKTEALRIWRGINEREHAERLRQMVDNMPDNFWLITDVARLDEFLAIVDTEEEIVFDVETTGVDVWSDYIVGHVITAIKADIHAYIPTKHRDSRTQLPHDYVNERLKPYYEDASIGKLAHNAKFDIHMLAGEGIELRGLTWDTQEAMKMLNENEPTFALKPLVTKYLNDPSSTYSELFGKKGFDEIGLDEAVAYAAKDGDVTLRLRNFQRMHLEKTPGILEYFTAVEIPLIGIVIGMERMGYEIDMDYAKEYGEKLRKEVAELQIELFRGLGDINFKSPAQLKSAIELAIGEKIENTDAKKTLKPLSKKHAIIGVLLEYRVKTRLLSNYIDALPDLINPDTGRLHTTLNQNGAKTGRFSSGKDKDLDGSEGSFNIQNQPWEARKLYLAPKGYVMVGADFSAQEIRCVTNYSREPILLEAFEKGKDSYATLASDYFGKPYEEVYKTADGDDTPERKMMKTVMLASIYGTSKYGLADQLSCTIDEADEFLKAFFAKYTYIKRWIDETQSELKRTGFVWIGDKMRKRRLPAAKSKSRGYDPKRNGAMRQGPNARVQGEAAIQTKMTLIKLDQLCKERGWHLWAPIHDEVLTLMPDTFTREDIKAYAEVMTQTYVFGDVLNATDVEVMTRWGEGMSVDKWFANKLQ